MHPDPPEQINDPAPSPYRWVMLGLLWLLYCAFGMVVRSASPLVTPMLRDLQMTYGQMGVVLGSWQLTYIGVAVWAGVLLDRWGIRRSLFFGTVVIGVSALLRFFPTGFGSLLAAVALFGVGGPMISIGAPKTIALWFQGRSRGTAVGIYTTGPWIGGVIALSATHPLVMPLTGHSWRLAFVCYGLLTLGIALLWWFLAREIRPEGSPASDESLRRVFATLIRVGNVRLILLAGLATFAVAHGFTNWLPRILETKAMSPSLAGLSASIPFVASIPAVLLIPRLTPPARRRPVVVLLSLCAAAAIVLIVATPVPPTIGLLLFGASGLCLFPMLMLVLMDTPEVGARHLGTAAGIFFCVAEMGGFLGPFAVGALVDFSGTFLAGSLCLAGLALSVAVLILRVREPAVPAAAKPLG